jgi:hypothetical protein
LTRKRARKKNRKKEESGKERADKCDNKQTPHSTTRPKKKI